MPADRDYLQSLTITVEPGGDGGPDNTTVLARDPNGVIVGWLDLFPENEHGRPVCTVEVAEHARRRGVATALWNRAEGDGLRPIHDSEMTDDGYAWAQTVPEKPAPTLPPRAPRPLPDRGR